MKQETNINLRMVDNLNNVKVMKHITKEGSREHVISWSSEGRRCSEPNCEVNKKQSSLGKDNCVGSSAIPCSYRCCQKALADQKAKMREIILYRIKKNNKFSHKLKPCFLQNRGRLLEAKRILKEFEELK